MKKIKNLDWQDKAFLVSLIIVFIIQVFVLSGLHQLPGPIYGGDVYFHQGIIHHMDNTLEPWKDPIFKEEYVFYPSFMHFLVALLSKITGLSVYSTTIYFSAIMTLTSMSIMYFLGKRFMSKTTGLILAILYGASFRFTHASAFASAVMIPLTVYFYYFSKKKKEYMIGGLLYAIGSVQSILIVLGIPILALVNIAKRLLIAKKKNKEWKKLFTDHAYYSLGFIIGLPIFLIFYWGPVLFKYKLHTINPWQEYTASGVQSLTFGKIISTVSGIFFNFSSGIKIIFSLVALFGIYYTFTKKKYFPLIVFFAGFLATIHPIITMPLFGTSFGWYRFPVYLVFSSIIFIAAGFNAIINIKTKYTNYKPIVIALISLILLMNILVGINAFKTNKWTQIGFTESPQVDTFQKVGDWLKENDPDAVVLSLHPESSFALFGVSGIKQVTSRRTHANLFVDINERNADAAIMLFSNNTEVVKELIEKYDVSYIFIESYGIQAQQQCFNYKDQMELEGYGDLGMNCYITDNNYLDSVKEAGLDYRKVLARLDPAEADGPRIELISIIPSQNLINGYIQNNSIQIFNENQVILLRLNNEN